MIHINCDVEVRKVYGNTLYYPISEQAKSFAELLNCKTLTIGQLRGIVKLGFNISMYVSIGEQLIECTPELLN